MRARLEERIPLVREHGDVDDIGTEDEKLLGEIIGEMYGQVLHIQ